MKAFFTIAALFGCAHTLNIVDIDSSIHKVCGYRDTGVIIAQSREADNRRDHERREDEIREHEVAAAKQRDKELRERDAETARESHDFKMHEFIKN